MNSEPLNAVTEEDKAVYQRDGVVCLRQMFDSEWIQLLKSHIEDVRKAPEDFGVTGPSHSAGMISVCYMWRKPGPVRDFIMQSPLGQIVGETIGADFIRIYHDHLFVKPPQSPKIMPWHNDESAWPVKGEMAPNIWVALDPVSSENGRVEFLAGYHKHCIENDIHYGFAPDQGAGLCPNFEEERNNPDFPFEFVGFDMQPGDAVIFHPMTPHFSKGNFSETLPRSGLAVRVFGNDVTWWNTPYKAPIPDVTDLPEGKAPEGEYFPVIWEKPSAKSHAA